MQSGVVATPIPPKDWHWSGNAFGSASKAMKLIGADWAVAGAGPVPEERDGHDVNVVIVDVGLNRDYIRALGGTFGILEDLYRVPGRHPQGDYVKGFGLPADWHGDMVARNVLRLAPKARIYDAPLLPHRVVWVEAFADELRKLYESIAAAISKSPHKDEPWVLVNAWSVANTIQDYDSGLTAEELYITGQLNKANEILNDLAKEHDIIFAAGNYGQFHPATGAGLYDRGPERSIRGSNAIGRILCVAACNTQGDWAGASSQGDGPEALRYGIDTAGKPDLAAPAWFTEDFDAHTASNGSSASCGVAAGLVASLRTQRRSLSPEKLFDQLRAAALNPSGTGWTRRTGHGILQVP